MSTEESLNALLNDIKSNLLYLQSIKAQRNENYAEEFLEWIREVTNKNIAIYNSKKSKDKQDHETYKKRRQKVYWINYGKNIGSEFNDYHYAVVIKESDFTALVIPISTEDEDLPDWKINEDLIIPIGVLQLPDKIDPDTQKPIERKPSFAMVHQMRVVSKKRLDRCGDKTNGYFEVELTNDQMKLIDDAIKKFLVSN